MATFEVETEDYDPSGLTGARGGPDWSIEPERATLLVHDMLGYYLATLGPTTRKRVVEFAGSVIAWSRAQGLAIVASGPRPASVLSQRGLIGELWGAGPRREEASATPLASLDGQDVTWVAKRSYSAFFATDLAVELRRRGRDQLVIVGVFASAGVLATTYDAFSRDIKAFVVVEATADHSADRHAAALALVAATTGRVLTTEDFTGRR